jgi:dihydroorotate dehydrogenase electron transfer subunit
VAGFERAAGTITTLVGQRDPGSGLRSIRSGEKALLDGPLGRGFALDPRSRHLLVVCDGAGMGRVRALLDEAVAGGRQVTLLLGVASAAEVFPSWLLPDEAEYVVATEDGSLGYARALGDLFLEYEAWADQCFAAGDPVLLGQLASLSRGRDARLGVARLGRKRGRRRGEGAAEARRTSWLQVALPHEAGCALGVCLGCVVDGVGSSLRVCREGPTFVADELAWGRDS